MDKNFIKNLIVLSLFFSAFLLVAKLAPPRLAMAQTPPGMMLCTTETCPDGHLVLHYCLANTQPICQFGCVTNGSCSGNSNNCTQNNTSYCQQLAGETAPGHPCTGACDQGTGNCVSSCPYCVAQPPRQDGCGNWGCPAGQMSYVQDSNWSDNGASCNNTHLVSCQPDPVACGGGPPPSSGGGSSPPPSAPPGGGGVGNTCPPNLFCSNGECRRLNPGCDSHIEADSVCQGAGLSCTSGTGGQCTGGPSCTGGNGAGCGANTNTCCQAGYKCTSSGGTTTGSCIPCGGNDPGCPPPVEDLLITPGTPDLANPQAGSVVLLTGTSATLQWRVIENPNPNGTCAGTGRSWTANMGTCPNGTTTYDPSVCSGGTQVYTACNKPNIGLGYAQCGNPYRVDSDNPDGTHSTTVPITSGKTYWWSTYTTCGCGATDSDHAEHNLFTTGGGPALAPTPICQRDARDPYSDLCNIPDAWSFAGALRHTVSVLDNGPDNTKTYLHNFTILDNTNPAALPIQINNVPGLGGSVVPAQIPLASLTLGHKYEWFANSTDPTTPPTSADSSPHWFFTYDNTGPTIVPGMTYGRCYATPQGANNPPPLQIFATDTSGIQSASVTISNNGPLVNVPLSFISGDPLLKNGTYSAPWPPLIVGGTYSVLGANAIDNAGNSNSVPTPNLFFLFSTVCTSPWLQTQQGDVHSNVNVNTPGGP